jgi:nicotinamidase-related amidase
MKPALLVIDVQKAFFKNPETAHSLDQAIVQINAGIQLFRDKKLPVICIQHMVKETGLLPDTEGFDLPESLNILPTDPHIHKTYGNAFNKTSLEQLLREQNIDTIIITGYCAEYCVLSTYRGALDLDFTPALLRGAIASRVPSNIPFVENVNDIISYGILKKLLSLI